MKKLFLFLTCIGCTLMLHAQAPEIDWFGEKGGGNGHKPGHSNGNGHIPGHSNGNGHNHCPINTGTTLLIVLATAGVTYKLSKNKNNT